MRTDKKANIKSRKHSSEQSPPRASCAPRQPTCIRFISASPRRPRSASAARWRLEARGQAQAIIALHDWNTPSCTAQYFTI